MMLVIIINRRHRRSLGSLTILVMKETLPTRYEHTCTSTYRQLQGLPPKEKQYGSTPRLTTMYSILSAGLRHLPFLQTPHPPVFLRPFLLRILIISMRCLCQNTFPVSHGGYWRIRPVAPSVREIFVGERSSGLFLPKYQYLYAAKAGDGWSIGIR
jgi:hypothetical protein